MTEILITSSVLILALLLLRKLFQKTLSRRVQYALWGLVLLRLLIPFNLPTPGFSVLTAVRPVEHTVTETMAEQPIYVPVAQAPLEEQPKARIAKPENTLIPVGQSVWIAQEEQQTAVQYKRISVQTILFWVWLAGCVTAAALLLLTNVRFWLWLRKVRKPFEAENCKRRVYLVEAGLPAPCLFGLFRPAIYLTPGAAETPKSLRHVLAHETTHARHLDHVWTFLKSVCLALYWFDPLVWAAAAASKTDCELACDEGALARLEEEDRIPYGETLLSLAVVRETGNPMLAATAMTTGKKRLKERIVRIANKSRQTVAVLVAVSLLVGAVSACTFTENKEKVIRILTDLGNNAKSAADVSLFPSLDAQGALETAMRVLNVELPEGFRVEVELMPTNADEYQTRLERLRIEIMAGEGPDIYVLSTADLYGPMLDPWECIFPDTERAMLDERFLNLDDYMGKAELMEFDKMNPTIMEAGCTPEGRFVLPMAYSFSAARITEPVNDTGAGWFDVMRGDDDALKNFYAIAAFWRFRGIFSELVDHETETLLFTEEELYDALSMILELLPPHGELPSREETIRNINIKTDFGPKNGWSNEANGWSLEPQDGAVYLPLRNREGGVSADVTAYIAINSNTPYPDEAFRLVDMMMSKKFQSGELGEYIQYQEVLPVFSWAYGIPVYDDFLQRSQPVHSRQYLTESMYPIWCELRDQITDARILSNMDRELFNLFMRLRWDDITPGDEMRQFIAEKYHEMVRTAGEL